jgi:hypothetical protein
VFFSFRILCFKQQRTRHLCACVSVCMCVITSTAPAELKPLTKSTLLSFSAAAEHKHTRQGKGAATKNQQTSARSPVVSLKRGDQSAPSESLDRRHTPRDYEHVRKERKTPTTQEGKAYAQKQKSNKGIKKKKTAARKAPLARSGGVILGAPFLRSH